jgi:hypothetical protein
LALAASPSPPPPKTGAAAAAGALRFWPCHASCARGFEPMRARCKALPPTSNHYTKTFPLCATTLWNDLCNRNNFFSYVGISLQVAFLLILSLFFIIILSILVMYWKKEHVGKITNPNGGWNSRI